MRSIEKELAREFTIHINAVMMLMLVVPVGIGDEERLRLGRQAIEAARNVNGHFRVCTAFRCINPANWKHSINGEFYCWEHAREINQKETVVLPPEFTDV